MSYSFNVVQDFKLKNGQFDISLIPDIYDCIKYDVQHNRFVKASGIMARSWFCLINDLFITEALVYMNDGSKSVINVRPLF